jgi:hypothetical protein
MGAPFKPVNRVAKGLIGFLGLKFLGRNPDTLEGDIRPTIDLREWMLRTNAEQLSQTSSFDNAAPLFGTPFAALNPSVVVPFDQWWYVHAATLIVVLPPTGFVSSPGIVARQSTQPSAYYEGIVTTEWNAQPTATNVRVNVARPGLWFAPGTVFGFSWAFMNTSGMIAGDFLRLNMHLSITRAEA